MSKTASKTTRKTGPISHCYQAMLNFVSTPLACSCSSSFQLSSALQAFSPRCSTHSLTHSSCYSQSLRQYWPTFVSFSPWTPRTGLLFHTLHHALIWVAPWPNLLRPVESRHMFWFNECICQWLPSVSALSGSSSYSFPCQGSDPSIYSIFTCAVKVVLLVTRMPTFVTEYCSFSQGQTPQSIALSLVLWRWFYLSQESPLSSLNTAVFLALSHYSSPAQSPSSSPLSPPAPEKKTDKTQVLSSFRWTSLIR